jgi:hypothetical protein
MAEMYLIDFSKGLKMAITAAKTPVVISIIRFKLPLGSAWERPIQEPSLMKKELKDMSFDSCRQ